MPTPLPATLSPWVVKPAGQAVQQLRPCPGTGRLCWRKVRGAPGHCWVVAGQVR